MEKIKLEYNVPIECTKQQYEQIRIVGSGLVSFREENNKFYIRPLIMKYKEPIQIIETILNNH